MIRLGINIDHVATVRQARREKYPDPVQAAVMAELGGADNITCHLREDRRHIQDRDLFLLKDTIKVPLNFEMAATSEMISIAKKVRPHSVTLVPEKRAELTTEGGLNLAVADLAIEAAVRELREVGILVSLFVDPDLKMIELSKHLGAEAIEIHTGPFCRNVDGAAATKTKWSLTKELSDIATHSHELGLQVHFGHGLHYTNAQWLQHVSFAEEANIGHAVVARAIFVGMTEAVREMKRLLNDPSLKP